MEPHLAELLENNHPPSDDVIQEVKILLLPSSQELEAIEAEIALLGARLQALKTKRDAIRGSRKGYTTILSPFRRLPSDIIDEIFYRCLTVQRNPILSSAEAPILLTHVSSTWRSIALSSPRLWAQIHITFSGDYHTFDNHPAGNEDHIKEKTVHTARNLRQRCDIVKDWLARSGTCPLSVSILYSPNSWNLPEDTQAGDSDPTIDLFKVIASHQQRWQNIELDMPRRIHQIFEAQLLSESLPLTTLTSLRLAFHENIVVAKKHGQIALLSAPNLKRVSISGNRPIWKLRLPLDQWATRLTSLCCHASVTIMNSLDLLKICGNLAYCKLFIVNNISTLGNWTDDLQTPGVLSLPNLRALSIVEHFADPNRMAGFYAAIDAPNLTWFDQQQKIQIMYTTDPPYLSFLRKSVQLKKLTVDLTVMPLLVLRRVLATVSPSLTHLVDGCEPEGPLRSVRGQPSDQDPVCLKLLTVENDGLLKTNPFGGPHDDSEILLPHLEVFESRHGTNLTDEQVLQFITSRMSPLSQGAVASLKCVRIMFDRTKKIDVVQAVEHFREFTGMRFDPPKLDLKYRSEDPPKVPGPTAPSFALSEDGRSWNYSDIEDWVSYFANPVITRSDSGILANSSDDALMLQVVSQHTTVFLVTLHSAQQWTVS
ncbi:hypothetical protein GALMADRAFT_152802 [Galerina marginata CBS 339.88]|uniref:F-box domain-containing protein n=1 Tax=Galerina marginata (strain CBS 339.88) TaxID=685588 RepID=A0A067TST1_GALM3|nr:hypothetical protein GALMADRAFT_152802 [Galerina marginata CBS 339.88]